MLKKYNQLILQCIIKSSAEVFIIIEQIFICLLYGKGIHKFKAKDSEIVATPLRLGNISKDQSVDNMKKWIEWVCL